MDDKRSRISRPMNRRDLSMVHHEGPSIPGAELKHGGVGPNLMEMKTRSAGAASAQKMILPIKEITDVLKRKI